MPECDVQQHPSLCIFGPKRKSTLNGDQFPPRLNVLQSFLCSKITVRLDQVYIFIDHTTRVGTIVQDKASGSCSCNLHLVISEAHLSSFDILPAEKSELEALRKARQQRHESFLIWSSWVIRIITLWKLALCKANICADEVEIGLTGNSMRPTSTHLQSR